MIQFEADDPVNDMRYYESNQSSVMKLRADLTNTIKEENTVSLTPSNRKETSNSPSKSRFNINLFSHTPKDQKSDSPSTRRFVAPTHTYSPPKDNNQALDVCEERWFSSGVDTQDLGTKTPKMNSAHKEAAKDSE